MDEKEIKGLRAHVRAGEILRAKEPEKMYVIDGDAYSYLSAGVVRLLEERKRLLEALRPILERIDGDRHFVIPEGGAEMIHAGHEAARFAEEAANP